MRNKKAILTEPIVIVMIFFLTVLFFLAFFLFLGKPEDTPVKKEFESLNQNIMLLSYLSAPVNITGISNVADLIILTIEDEKEFRPKLEDISEEILTPFFEKPYFWSISVFEENKKKYGFCEKKFCPSGNPIQTLEQIIPNQIGKKPEFYTVKLIKWED